MAFRTVSSSCSERSSRTPNAKAGHSTLFQSGIFGTREGQTYRQNRKPMKIVANGLEVTEFQRTQNRKLHPPISTLDLDAREAAKQRICLHWDLAFGFVPFPVKIMI
ncbi:hypothetical protein AVEN_85161-1 [Araneus ventricosus]|uniref:Uncharacterized protein n=1 Tax=Araneus ventricosus TaxID=182803 RepID=A0A4Y2LI30_ARAVE|nr:hypothetical protein AVEN_85161-1 [Araneus ventricosus]